MFSLSKYFCRKDKKKEIAAKDNFFQN